MTQFKHYSWHMAVYNFLLVVYINKNGNHETSSIQLHCFILGWDKTKENSLDTMWWDVNLPVPPLVSCGWLCAPGKRVVWTKSQNCWPPNHHSSQPACDTTRMKQVSNQWYIWERDRERFLQIWWLKIFLCEHCRVYGFR